MGLVGVQALNKNIDWDGFYKSQFKDKNLTDPKEVIMILQDIDKASVPGFVNMEYYVNKLIWLPRHNQCRQDAFSDYRVLRDIWANRDAPSINNFIEHFATKFFLKCHDQLGRGLRSSVSDLSEDTKNDLQLIEEVFIKPYGKSVSEQLNNLNLPEDFNKRVDIFFSKKGGQSRGLASKVFGALKKVVTSKTRALYNFCLVVMRETDAAISRYVFITNASFVRLFDEFELKWIPSLHFCGNVYRNLYVNELW